VALNNMKLEKMKREDVDWIYLAQDWDKWLVF
jgi:hypothetical protein